MGAKVWHGPVLHARGALAYQSTAAVFKVAVAWHGREARQRVCGSEKEFGSGSEGG